MSRGTTLLELLVGAAIGLAVLAAVTAVVGTGGRALLGLGARGEGEDTAALAVEALAVDVRRAGWDATAAGVEAIAEATPSRLTVLADLDGDAAIDLASEERVAWECGPGRLSRIVGLQSLPVANGVVACAFGYVDAAGAPLPAPAAGLAAGERARVAAVSLDLALRPTGLRVPATRRTLVALRGRP